MVLVGSETASRKWVDYEIRKAWDDKRPLVGIRIHGLKGLDQKTASRGANPFSKVTCPSGVGPSLVGHVGGEGCVLVEDVDPGTSAGGACGVALLVFLLPRSRSAAE